jgi:hypothetical protein
MPLLARVGAVTLLSLLIPLSGALAQDAAALVNAINGLRSGLPPLVPQADLIAAATAVATDTPAGPDRTLPIPDADQIKQGLVSRLYIPMELDVLIALAGADGAAAAAVWNGTADTRGSLQNPALQEIGTAVAPNPKSTGPNDAYLWVALLARPLRTPAESEQSPRFGR